MDLAITATIITICTSAITIIWFIRDVRKENSKVLKEMASILKEIAGGQVIMTKILDKIESNTKAE